MKARYERAQAFLAMLAHDSPELPFEPALLPELFASTADNSMRNTAYIAGLVERSPGIAARILRLANSAYYGMQTKVSSLEQGVRLLGLNEVRNIILQIGVTAAVMKLPLPPKFPFVRLWEHQLITANMAKAMGNILLQLSKGGGAGILPDELYVAGLLHDMGKTMVAAHCPNDWEAIHDLACCENLTFAQAEEDYWGIDHAAAGARLLTFWGVPMRLVELVNWHHAPHLASPEFLVPARVVAAANLLSHDAAPVLEEAGEDLAPVPEDVAAILPEGLNVETLAQTLAACCDFDRVRSMARMTMDQ